MSSRDVVSVCSSLLINCFAGLPARELSILQSVQNAGTLCRRTFVYPALLSTCKRRLKTELFSRSFPDWCDCV